MFMLLYLDVSQMDRLYINLVYILHIFCWVMQWEIGYTSFVFG